MKPALLVVDIQNAWIESNEDLKRSVERRLGVINDTIKWFRKAKRPVIVIYHEDKSQGATPGSRLFEFPAAVEISDTDTRVTKHYPDSFCKTGLEGILREKGCDAVVISGLSASGCVLGTFFGALNSDLEAFLLEGGVASHSEDHVRFAEEICGTMSLKSLRDSLP